VKLLLDIVAAQQPGLMDPQDLRQVAKTAETNKVNPAVLVLGVPQLTQLAAAIFPLEVLEEVVASAVEQAQTALLSMVRRSTVVNSCSFTFCLGKVLLALWQ
jgi:hypothetical protein